ncbi:hypothetical protein L6452_35871 [Arctium lappa]|uniref:Uncharacterized protein n=1 Tax=Arctium lappa TaxID=4217 RepID=A0ACB8Y892_ARCLA|nr:hypothetical protein L6452_35871 [Arctium lappa]
MGKSSICPGFRFHPTDVELVMYYLKKKLLGKKLLPEVIAEVNIYDFSPWDLPAKSNLRNGDLEWFFFCSKSKKYLSGFRMNRATEAGYWKATGKDREVKYKGKTVAKIKTLVFHLDHPPKGKRTDWVMHEYRMEDRDLANVGVVQEAYVLCKLFEKSGAGPKNGAQYGAPFEEEDWDSDEVGCSESSAMVDLSGVKETVNLNSSSSAVTNMTLNEPGPSTITSSENERNVDVPPNDIAMITHEDIASILDNNNTQEVEDHKGKKIMTKEDDGVFKDLAPLSNLDDLDVDYMLDMLLADDIDVDLGKFFTG